VRISRRTVVGALGIGLVAPAQATQIRAAASPKGQPAWRHAASLFGDLKYPSGFSHFDYVDSVAAKGGNVRQSAPGTYDNFNLVTEGVKGNLAAGIDLIYDTLLLPSLDESNSISLSSRCCLQIIP